MKKIDEILMTEYPPLVLHRGDLEEIERLLRVEAESTEIEADGYQYDSVAEFAEHLGEHSPRTMEFRSSNPFVKLELHPMWSKLYVGAGGVRSAGVFQQIDSILRSRTRSLPWTYSIGFITGVGALAGAAAVPLIRELGWPWASMLIAGIVGRYGWTLWIVLRRHSTIRPVKRPASLLLRKRDDLFVAAVSGLLGALLGAGVTLLVQWLTSRPRP